MEEMPELIDLDQFMTKVEEHRKTVEDVASKGQDELLKFKKQEHKKINKQNGTDWIIQPTFFLSSPMRT